MNKLEISISDYNHGLRVEYVPDPALYVTIKESNNKEHHYVNPSWDKAGIVVSSSAEAIGGAINLIDIEIGMRNQPKPLTAKEAFAKVFKDHDLDGASWVVDIVRGTELYVTSQIENLKKELQK